MKLVNLWLIGGFLSLIGFANVSWAQVVPYGVKIEDGVKILVFVESNCDACEALQSEFEGLPATYIGADLFLPYTPYLTDTENQLVARTFRVPEFPSVYVLKDGQVATKFEGGADRSTVEAAVKDVEAGTVVPEYTYTINIGEHLTGEFSDYTGFLVFYRESCEKCQEEKPILSQLCESGELSITILATRDEPLPEGCSGEFARQTALDWGIPGVPSVVYLDKGVVTWVDLGFREDLAVIAEDLVETQGGTQ